MNLKNIIKERIVFSLLLISIIGVRFLKTLLNISDVVNWNLLNEGFNISTLFLITPYIAFAFLFLSIWIENKYSLIPMIIGVLLQIGCLFVDLLFSFIIIMGFSDYYAGYSPFLDICMLLSYFFAFLVIISKNIAYKK